MKKYIDTNLCIVQSTPADPNYKDKNYYILILDYYTSGIREGKWFYTEEEAFAEARRLNKEERVKAKRSGKDIRYKYEVCEFDPKNY